MSRGIVSIAVGNLASKAVGLFREVLFAAWFGTGEVAAAFRIAQTAFLLPTHALIGDSLGPGLLPLYRSMQTDASGRERVLVLVASLYAAAFSLVCGGLLYLLSHQIVLWIAPGTPASTVQTASTMLRILSVALPFYVLGYMLGYIEAGHGRFGAIAWRPLAFNLGSILGAGLAVATGTDHWIAIGLVIGNAVFFAWTIVQMRHLGRVFPESAVTPGLLLGVSSRFFRNVAPLLALPLLAQMNIVVERIISSGLGADIIPSVDYARFVSETAIQLIAVPIGIKTMTLHDGRDSEESNRHVRMAAALVMVTAVPLGVFILQSASDIISVLFERGRFDQEAVRTTSSLLRWFGGSLGAAVTGYYLVKALNAQLRNRAALCVIGAAVVANMSVNLCFGRLLGPQVIGLGSATYAIVLLTGGMTLLRLWRSMGRLMAWLSFGFVASVVLSDLMPAMSPILALVAKAVFFGSFWGALVLYVPSLRQAADPLLSRIRLPKGRQH